MKSQLVTYSILVLFFGAILQGCKPPIAVEPLPIQLSDSTARIICDSIVSADSAIDLFASIPAPLIPTNAHYLWNFGDGTSEIDSVPFTHHQCRRYGSDTIEVVLLRGLNATLRLSKSITVLPDPLLITMLPVSSEVVPLENYEFIATTPKTGESVVWTVETPDGRTLTRAGDTLSFTVLAAASYTITASARDALGRLRLAQRTFPVRQFTGNNLPQLQQFRTVRFNVNALGDYQHATTGPVTKKVDALVAINSGIWSGNSFTASYSQNYSDTIGSLIQTSETNNSAGLSLSQDGSEIVSAGFSEYGSASNSHAVAGFVQASCSGSNLQLLSLTTDSAIFETWFPSKNVPADFTFKSSSDEYSRISNQLDFRKFHPSDSNVVILDVILHR